MKIGIGIPSPERVHPDFALHSLPQIVQYTRDHLKDIEIFISYEQGVRTDRNRNIILTRFIEEQVDYVLWLDADMVYPADIIERYLELEKLHGEMQPIGCLYFKRSGDHNPIGYVDSGKESQPYRPLMPQLLKKGKIYEVTGVGYGGLMIPMKVYNKLGDDKWTHYGKNFHNPHAITGNLTHDLEFCKTLTDHGFKIFIHGSVRPGHIGEVQIGEKDFFDKFPPKLLPGLKVAVIMPTTDVELAQKAASVMKSRAGYDCDIIIVEDKDRKGFVSTLNTAYKNNKGYHFIVYTAQDAFVGKNWLANALLEQFKTQASLVSFNDGKWDGQLASFGLIECSWASSLYGDDVFFSGYHSHYADTELTQIAKDQNTYAYAENAIMMEIDYNKAVGRGKGVVKKDKKLYKKRIKEVVSDKKLQVEFS